MIPCAAAKALRRPRGVRTRAIEQQPDGPRPAVIPPQLSQEPLRIDAARLFPREHYAVCRPDFDRAEQHTLCVPASDRHDARRPDRRPGGAERWEHAQDRPVADKHRVAGLESRSQATAETTFFCPR